MTGHRVATGLSVEHASVVFPAERRATALVALDDVSLGLAPGERLAILGPSGSGKSTLLRAIAGLDDLSAGRILWDGDDLAPVPPHRRGFALMFQDGQLFRHRSVAGNVGYALEVRGTPRVERAEIIADLLATVGLEGLGDRRIQTLSGGQQQRVALARSLAAEPRLLLLDEPLSALDRALRERLGADLAEILAARGTTTILVTHDVAEAQLIAGRVVHMEAGRLEP